MSDALTIREASETDIPEMLAVLSASLGETALLQRTPDLFAWKHADNPFGHSIVLIAEVEGRIAGVRAFMRWDLATADGTTIRCVRAVDTATHPEYQGRGVFRDLTLTAVDHARNQGIDLIFNTPNEKSAPGYLKMGWKEVGHIRPMVRPRLGRATHPGGNGLTSLASVLPEADGVIPTKPFDRPPMGLRTPRTPEYVDWRFHRHPSARYGFVADHGTGGAIVRASVRRGRTELLITELSSEARFIRSLARAHRARYMATAFSKGSPEWSSARAAGMFQPPGISGLTLVANPLRELDFDVFDLDSWDLSLGDLELL